MTKNVYAGLDVSQSWASLVLLFPPSPTEENSRYRAKVCFWATEKALYSLKTGLAQLGGEINIIPGDLIEYPLILSQIHYAATTHQLSSVGVDPWSAASLLASIEQYGLKTIGVGMGYDDMFAPTMRMRLLIESGMFTADNPVFDWMLCNLKFMQHVDGRIKPDTSRSTGSISGVLALVRALALLMKNKQISYAPCAAVDRLVLSR